MPGFLFDMDGVLYNSDQPIPGAVETIQWVKAHGIPHLFATNTSSRDRTALVEKLNNFGIPTTADEIITPAWAAAAWLRHNATGSIALFVRPAARREFDGLSCLPDDAEQGADYVVIGDLGQHWNYQHLNRAFRLLHHNPHAQLIALGRTRYWLSADGISLDVAPFVAALEEATGRKALVFGKPDARFFHAASARLNLPPAETWMIGDDIDADVGGAQRAGLNGILVRTGKFRPADLTGAVKPHIVLDSIADLPTCGLHASRHGVTIWFTGLSGTGKTTLSNLLAAHLRQHHSNVEVLDGDVVRAHLCRGLGFSKPDREENIRRLGYVCELLSRNGAIAIAAAISPYRACRETLRARIPNFIEVHTHCPIDVLIQRDPKGLYKKALSGEIANFTGISDPYEPPLNPEVTIDSSIESPEQSLKLILSALKKHGILS